MIFISPPLPKLPHFGDYQVKLHTEIYQAATDGIVHVRSGDGIETYGLVGTESPPADREPQRCWQSAVSKNTSFSFGVKKGLFWQAVGDGQVYWLPILNT